MSLVRLQQDTTSLGSSVARVVDADAVAAVVTISPHVLKLQIEQDPSPCHQCGFHL